MQRGKDGVLESTPVTAHPHRAEARGPRVYVIRADLEAGTVSVLWPAGQGRALPRRAAPRGRGREGHSSP